MGIINSMRLIKAFLVGVTGMFIVITLFSLLIPARVRVSRAVLINNTHREVVYDQVANISNWHNWHPVFINDSAKLFPGQHTGEESSAYHIVHHGQEVSISFLPADTTSIKFLLEGKGENAIQNELIITTLSSQQTVQVEWRSITKLRWYPWDKFYGIFIDKMTGPGYEAALKGLKDFIERSPA